MGRNPKGYWKKYYAEHREQLLAKSNAYGNRFPEERKRRCREWYAANRESERAKQKAARDANPDYFKARRRAEYRKHAAKYKERERLRRLADPGLKRRQHLRSYGLTPESFQAILDRQGGGCAICGGVFPIGGRTGLHIDHCHANGHVRGILCSNCNMGIGKFHDSASRLRAAADYIERTMACVVRAER
jgi:hypothetical protein